MDAVLMPGLLPELLGEVGGGGGQKQEQGIDRLFPGGVADYAFFFTLAR